MQELCEWDELKTFFDRRLASALGHPVREHILAVLNERVASGTEIGDEVGADVSSFFHHFEQLEKLGCIERVDSRRNRGAMEHFFRATRTVYFDDEAWERLPATVRADMATSFVQRMFDAAVAAVEGGTLGRGGEEHVTWSPLRVDEQGWSEVTALMNETLEQVAEIQKRSATRMTGSDSEHVSGTVAMLAFQDPQKKAGSGAKSKASAPA